MTDTLTVNDGIELSYIDSGPPSDAVYATIFAVHGVEFTSPIFRKVSALSRAKGTRFVAINRREYKGSTPFSDAEKTVMSKGAEPEKTKFMKDRGLELAYFVNAFIQREKLPPVSADGKKGGVALLGWSAGATLTAAAIAHVGALPSPVQARLASHVRAHIMQEPPSIAFGLPLPPLTFTPQIDTSIPENTRIPAFTRWITSYFQHGDLSTRDLNVIEYVLPATFRTPSIWNMTMNEIADIVDEGPSATVELPLALNFIPQVSAIYNTATYDKATRALLPHMKVWEVVGDCSASFALAALWSIQDDDKAHGGNNVEYAVVPGANHFIHWDDPEKAVKVYLDALV